MPTCPNGHQSESDDWCEVCGLRMSAAAAGPGVTGPPPPPFTPPAGNARTGNAPAGDPDATVAAERCPSCGTVREGRASFCEECRYNFLTHAPTQNATAPYLPPPPSPAPAPPPVFPPPYERTSSRPSQMNRSAEPLPPDVTITGENEVGGDDFLLPPPTSGGRGLATAQPEGHSPGPGFGPASDTWTAVVTADRDYFTAMMARSGPDATGLYFPPYSPERYVPLTSHQITIGRRRHSTGESADIDLSRPPEDPGVSHRHAVLVRRPDGGWSVIDQDSTNGTTLNGGADPIEPFQPVGLADGDRVHVGAWTTITLRRD